MGACRGQNRANREPPQEGTFKGRLWRVELVQRPCGRRMPDPVEKQQAAVEG